MKIQQLRYVVMVAEKGSISEASKALFISQPSLTNAIKELEKEMNIQIFDRTNKGVTISNEGDEFLGYARQVLEQADLLLNKYKENNGGGSTQRFWVSTQHYSFAVNAFVDVIREFGENKYDFTLRETQTHEIIDDVSRLKSELGILYLSDTNETVIRKMLRHHELKFEELFIAKPHVFISSNHPLQARECLSLDDLMAYPYLSFEQGDYNSFYYSEEIMSTIDRDKNIKVRDRATLFNLLIGLNGYTISTGVIDEELNGENIVARRLNVDEVIRVGVITHKKGKLSRLGQAYMEAIKRYIE